MGIEEQIKEVEEEIQKTPYNKATQYHIGKLKAKLAKLRMQLEAGKGKGKGAASLGYSLKKSGDATVIIVGFPSVGKSTLLNALANEELSKVAAYEFTTLKVIPAMLKYKNTRIQLLDVPGLVSGASKGKGRGKEVIAVLRTADVLLLMAEAKKLSQLETIKTELYDAGIRINQTPPNVEIKKKSKGGIEIGKTCKQGLSDAEIISVLNEFSYLNADVVIRQQLTIDQFIDAVAGNRKYVRALDIVNKIDVVSKKYVFPKDAILISAKNGLGLENLKEQIFNSLGFMRVYLKPPGKPADYENPLIIKKGAKIEDVCKKLHREFVRQFKYAQVTGKSVKFKEQRVGLNHSLADEDVVTIFVKD